MDEQLQVGAICLKQVTLQEQSSQQLYKNQFLCIAQLQIFFCAIINIFPTIMEGELSEPSLVFVKKEREVQNDEKLGCQEREARKCFLVHCLPKKLKQAKAAKQASEYILAHVLDFGKKERHIDRQHLIYSNLIRLLKQQFSAICEKYIKMQRECLPMLSLIQRQPIDLKVIRIQYQKRFKGENAKEQFPYSISAFQFFKIVYDNKQLMEVVIRGVELRGFDQFVELLNQCKYSKRVKQQKEEFVWIKYFNLPKSLRISIDIQIIFSAKNEQNILYWINSLSFFGELQIKTKVQLDQWNGLSKRVNILQNLWAYFSKMNKNRIEIEGYQPQSSFQRKISFKQIAIIRSVIFGRLASLSNVVQLSLSGIKFAKQIDTNNSLAIEQTLKSLFQNNFVLHLRLSFCQNLPTFPQIKTLQSISLKNVSFRQQPNFISRFTQTSLRLKSIRLQLIDYSWKIDNNLFNELQTLIIRSCNPLLHISSEPPSKIRRLNIKTPGTDFLDKLHLVFPKLLHLTYLSLSYMNLSHQLICTIPSPHLEELHLVKNSLLTNQGLKEIDQRWPYLSHLSVLSCESITSQVWGICIFEGLKKLAVHTITTKDKYGKAIPLKERQIQRLKLKGIKVQFVN